jgi:hypothetical protein
MLSRLTGAQLGGYSASAADLNGTNVGRTIRPSRHDHQRSGFTHTARGVG